MASHSKRQDPSTRMLRSGFGAQVKSTQESCPSVGFGSSHRDASVKQYISPEHARAMGGNNSQGPVYKTYSSMGPQPESGMTNPGTMSFGTSQRLPRYGRSAAPGPGQYQVSQGIGEQQDSRRSTSPRPVFGTCTRDGMTKVYLDAELMRTYYGKESPPPGAYNVPGAVGKQCVSTKASAPGIKIGTGLRDLDNKLRSAKGQPGPGQYQTASGVGPQALSSKKTLPAVSFGTGTRDALVNKAYISKEHGKATHGAGTPGPTTASPYDGTGRQLLSTRQSSPGWGFGTGRRLKDYMNDSPGVGSYYA